MIVYIIIRKIIDIIDVNAKIASIFVDIRTICILAHAKIAFSYRIG